MKTVKDLIDFLSTLDPDIRIVRHAGGDASGYCDFNCEFKKVDLWLDKNTCYGGPHYDDRDMITEIDLMSWPFDGSDEEFEERERKLKESLPPPDCKAYVLF